MPMTNNPQFETALNKLKFAACQYACATRLARRSNEP